MAGLHISGAREIMALKYSLRYILIFEMHARSFGTRPDTVRYNNLQWALRLFSATY